MTYRKLLKETTIKLKEANIETADLDAKVLLKHILKIDDTTLYKNFDQPVNKKAVSKIEELVERRANKEPIAYLIKNKEFFGLKFYINENVLIPRPESEYLIEESIKYVESNIKYKKINILDMGTGSGCLIISLAKNLNDMEKASNIDYFATDISPAALKVAIHNAKQNAVFNKINFLESNLFSNKDLPEKFDLIIANLPYVPDDEIDESVKFEPHDAIFAADNGTEIIKNFLVQTKNYLQKEGMILIELDPRNAQEIKEYTKKKFPDAKIELKKDLAGLDRYLAIN
jgi:release factor glutamine methyltransferase